MYYNYVILFGILRFWSRIFIKNTDYNYSILKRNSQKFKTFITQEKSNEKVKNFQQNNDCLTYWF